MVTTTQLEIANCAIHWNDAPENQTVDVTFGFLNTQEEADALEVNLDNEVEHWVWFDEQIFMWVERYRGETLATLSNEFTVVKNYTEE